MPIDNTLSNRLALITGASGGIGAACARDLFAAGASLALTYSTNQASVDELMASLLPTAHGRTITSHRADMAQDADLHRLYDEIRRQHGHGPDILVANAGYGKRVANIHQLHRGGRHVDQRVSLFGVQGGAARAVEESCRTGYMTGQSKYFVVGWIEVNDHRGVSRVMLGERRSLSGLPSRVFPSGTSGHGGIELHPT
jgi:NAD(P)-dependent dehydrogenase (short-subunit alcohol dehydrogenase family)